MAKQSAGILLYRKSPVLQVLLVYPGGPFYSGLEKDGNWSIPKGEFEEGEEPLTAAIREMTEETGYEPAGEFIRLTPVKQLGGKMVHCWAVEGDLDPSTILSNEFEMEWPPKSGKRKTYPEIDRAEWFPLTEARQKIKDKQAALVEELETLLK